MEANRQVPTSPRTKAGRWSTLGTTAATLGIVLGLGAVALEVLFAVRPPDAYGICIACHGRDLVNSVVNALGGTSLTVADASLAFPLLTVAGIVVGASVAALIHGEFRWYRSDLSLPTFLWGFLVMNFALLAAGCFIRIILRAANGEVLGILTLAVIAAGTGVTTILMKKRALR